MTEVIEAEIIESELAVTVVEPTIADNLTALSAYVDKEIEPFLNWTVDVSDKKRITEAKKVIAELPKLKKKIEDERKRVKKAYTAPLDAFEKRVKEVTTKIELAYRGVKNQIDDAEQAARDRRYDRLHEVYEEFAPALVPMVEFDQVLEKEWLRLSMNEKRAEDELCDKLAKLAKDWRVLKESQLRCKEETEVEFFRTLDLNAALAFDKEHAEEIERLNELKAEVEGEPEVEDIEPEDSGLDVVRMALNDDVTYRFTIEVPKTEFITSVDEATALKNHLAILGVKAIMTKSAAEVAA